MALAIGAIIALAVGVLGTGSGMDRDRAYYPVITIVIAAYYVLFAAMGASPQVLLIESLIGLVFLGAAVAGFKSSLWIVVAALAAHGIQDLGHHLVVTNPGVPPWWPPFCFAADVGLAAYLGWLIRSGRASSRPGP